MLAAALAGGSAGALVQFPGCAAQNAKSQHDAHTDSSLFDPSITDLINLSRPAATQPTTAPAPQVIRQGDKSTLVYTARHARPEALRDAVLGLINPDGTITESPALNAVIIQDKSDVVDNVLAVLESLDKEVPQLLVEARVVEVTLNDDLEYEIKHTLVVNSATAFLQGATVDLETPGANPTSGQGIGLSIRPWAGSNVQLDNFIRLLETKGKANILSSPNLIVAPGTEASIITGEEVPIQSTTVVSGSLTTNTVFKRVGIKLRVDLQQITNDTARLEINPEVSTVTGSTTSNGVANPIISLRNVSSTVSLKDGETLTVGGLLQNENQRTTLGIPLLQDIPVAGVLFQSRRDQTVKTQLIFFLRVHILPEGVPDSVRLHKPGVGFEKISESPTLLNPSATTLPAPSLNEVTNPHPSVPNNSGKQP
ncbi:MAG TPA: hypothetical protein VHQ47_08695 [Phycisphaerae bacterium]|nr:hypothetical protein [Phycisphaerae bacterium]